jgi:hypothetical protein
MHEEVNWMSDRSQQEAAPQEVALADEAGEETILETVA